MLQPGGGGALAKLVVLDVELGLLVALDHAVLADVVGLLGGFRRRHGRGSWLVAGGGPHGRGRWRAPPLDGRVRDAAG